MDLSASIIPNSSQINADDLIAAPITYTIRDVRQGSAEQPIDILLVETDRAYRPSKSMRRVLVTAWGANGTAYVGRRLTLYRDPKVRFGSDEVGGIKISHLSHIDKPLTVALTVTRGRRAPHIVQPLADWTADIAGATTEAELRAIWDESDKSPAVSAAIKTRRAEIGDAS